MGSILEQSASIAARENDAGLSSIQQKLAEIDWSFQKRGKIAAIETIHPYPAKFIGDIPRALIDTLPIPVGTGVLDPFSGSGTTLVESQRVGLPSIGIDLNPIACLISRVKTSPLPGDFMDVVEEVIERASNIRSLAKPDIPNVDHWFKAEIQLAVGALAETIADIVYLPWLDQLRLSLSGILVRVSNQDSDTRYAAIDKNISYNDVFKLFYASAAKIMKALAARKEDLATSRVIEANTLEVQPEDIDIPIGLVVTSPPYPNAYEYWLYHKYRMWWLGFDPLSVKEKEIGARAHFFKKNHHTAELFVEQMRGVFSLVNKVLVQDGFVCFVVGRSKIHGKIIDNGEIIDLVASEVELKRVSRFERVIKANRKSFNLSHANIKTETVLVFQKR